MAQKQDATEPPAEACPFNTGSAAPQAASAASSGCPFSPAAFDPFDTPFQLDPAEALRWARAQQPVFYSEAFGYWIVTRYDEVKAVFRDNVAFSPSVALERLTQPPPEAAQILARYNYAMNRTLVNEDEPLHMERRRALQQTFAPDNLADFEPMVRRLTRQYMDRFIDKGEADLVNEMFWEIPLTVALHFLGVPEEDMETIRRYSIAHTVNTWGRPKPEEQLAVAETIGRFWQFSGEILQKMRANPDGSGWMHHCIRQQSALPELVSDNFLQSNMMAGIVAAHETTANATANAFKVLLQNRAVWEEICADPQVIPNAVEECLRFAGSVVAWRRLALTDTEIGGTAIPKGAKLLIVMASANHDERRFDNPDELDIYRENTSDHLTFGYGAHQCLGKNLARMQMRVYLEAFSRRLPHMELVSDQTFTYLPSISFRGPDHLHVRWDPALNPERSDPGVLNTVTSFGVGAPSKHGLARRLRVVEAAEEAAGVLRLTLEDPQGRPLPKWKPGAHLDMEVGVYQRKYSLCGEGDERRYHVAVLKEESGRGGSAFIHETMEPGTVIAVRGPKNHFPLDEDASRYLLIAGGIGITPIIAMADRLKQLGRPYEVHYCGRSLSSMAFLNRLERDHGERLHVYAKASGRRLDLDALIASLPADVQVYACGPDRMLTALEQAFSDQPERLHLEHFSSAAARLDPDKEAPFEVELGDSQLTLAVPAGQTLLQTLHAAGIDVASDCEEGLCGSCEVAVISGEIDHRDKVLSASERATGRRMMACCSRGRGKLRLAL